jgi:hypothetical protein
MKASSEKREPTRETTGDDDHSLSQGRPARPRLHYGERVAIDTEALGLNLHRDRLCVVQLSPGDGTADVVQIAKGQPRRRTSRRCSPTRRC